MPVPLAPAPTDTLIVPTMGVTFCRRTQDYPENLAVCNVIRINYMTSVHFSYGIVLYVQDI
jgi:hypothetical protein